VFLLTLCATGGCTETSWPLWNSYAARFIDGQGRVFDPKGDTRTTSEGQAYAMFFALADNDRTRFDRVLAWTRDNLAQGDLETHLPAWLWGKNKDGEWKTLDPNAASDADVWIAYTLVEAGALWKHPGYANLGEKMLALIAKSEVTSLPGFGLMLMPGPAGFQHDQSWTLNPSYLPVFLFERLASVDPAGPWREIAKNIPRFLVASSRNGFAMDWVGYAPGDGFHPVAERRPGSNAADDPGGGYDAIRVYLWAGMLDGRAKMRSEVLKAIPAMSVYLASHDAPPEKISGSGIPLAKDGPVGFSVAVLPYLRAYPGVQGIYSQQMARMNSLQDRATGLYGKDLTYYDQNLALFSTGFLDDRFRFGSGGELKVEWKRR
jgi:endoglucanase